MSRQDKLERQREWTLEARRRGYKSNESFAALFDYTINAWREFTAGRNLCGKFEEVETWICQNPKL